MMPGSESGLSKGADLRREFPEGSKLVVQVVELEPREGRPRIRLSRQAVLDARERQAYESYLTSQEQSQSQEEKPLGRLGQLLKEKGFELKKP